jgi:hypothetical protein
MADAKIDAEGTQPGLAPTTPKEKILNLKCRNPRSCDGMEATETSLNTPAHHGHRLYRCVKCGHSWGVSLGGHFEF